MSLERIHAINTELSAVAAEHAAAQERKRADRRSEHTTEFDEVLQRINRKRHTLEAEKKRLKDRLIPIAAAKLREAQSALSEAHLAFTGPETATERLRTAQNDIEDRANRYASELDQRLRDAVPITIDFANADALCYFFGHGMIERLEEHGREWVSQQQADFQPIEDHAALVVAAGRNLEELEAL